MIVAAVAISWPAQADQEASNVAHVVADSNGRCYAKSIPDHVYDPVDVPRQQGQTTVFRVGNPDDVQVQSFDWFSQQLFITCGPVDDIAVVRLGPWHRGHNPHSDHLAIAFYLNGKLVKRYSTLDISGDEKNTTNGFSNYQNVSASVSHYTVFEAVPEMLKITTSHGSVFKDNWVIVANTVDGRVLTFDITTGELK